MQSALEKKRRKFRELYELLFTDYRIRNYRISEKLGYRSVGALLEEAREEKYITGPEIRKLSYANTSEHVYFFDAEDPSVAYMKYRKDPRVVYKTVIRNFNTFRHGSSYANHWFVFSSNYESVIKDIFSFLPTSSLIAEFGDQLMVSCCLKGVDTTREILKIVSTLEDKEITSECCEAVVVLEYQH